MYDTLDGTCEHFRFARGHNAKPETFVQVKRDLVAVRGRKLYPLPYPSITLHGYGRVS